MDFNSKCDSRLATSEEARKRLQGAHVALESQVSKEHDRLLVLENTVTQLSVFCLKARKAGSLSFCRQNYEKVSLSRSSLASVPSGVTSNANLVSGGVSKSWMTNSKVLLWSPACRRKSRNFTASAFRTMVSSTTTSSLICGRVFQGKSNLRPGPAETPASVTVKILVPFCSGLPNGRC